MQQAQRWPWQLRWCLCQQQAFALLKAAFSAAAPPTLPQRLSQPLKTYRAWRGQQHSTQLCRPSCQQPRQAPDKRPVSRLPGQMVSSSLQTHAWLTLRQAWEPKGAVSWPPVSCWRAACSHPQAALWAWSSALHRQAAVWVAVMRCLLRGTQASVAWPQHHAGNAAGGSAAGGSTDRHMHKRRASCGLLLQGSHTALWQPSAARPEARTHQP